MPHEVIMPALGMAQETGLIVAWRKAEGDPVAIGDPLFDVETDKTTMEVEATHAGTLTEIRADAGADIPVGQTIAIIASGDAGLDLAPETTAAVETKPPTSPITPTAPKPPERPRLRDKPAAPSTPSIASTILASPKAKFEAHRRGIDLKRLVDQGIAQPFHVADLDRLQPETATAALSMSQLSATLELQALDAFVLWAERKTSSQNMRARILAAFAAAAFRSGNASDLIVAVISLREGETTYRDPDLRGLGEPADSAVDQGSRRSDLVLVDLTETRLTDYQPPVQSGVPTIIFAQGVENGAVATLHFCEDNLPLLSAARFLDGFAERINVPALQLL